MTDVSSTERLPERMRATGVPPARRVEPESSCGPGSPSKSGHPLGPLVERIRCQGGRRSRLAAVVVAAAASGILGVAVYLKPDPSGTGTHRQLGYGPCGMLVMTGLPCPTCGMTTAFAETVRGRLWAAFRAQPMGMVLCLMTAVVAVVAVSVAATGRMWRINWYRIPPNRVIWAGMGLFIGAWAFKIAVTLLDAGRAAR